MIYYKSLTNFITGFYQVHLIIRHGSWIYKPYWWWAL